MRQKNGHLAPRGARQVQRGWPSEDLKPDALVVTILRLNVRLSVLSCSRTWLIITTTTMDSNTPVHMAALSPGDQVSSMLRVFQEASSPPSDWSRTTSPTNTPSSVLSTSRHNGIQSTEHLWDTFSDTWQENARCSVSNPADPGQLPLHHILDHDSDHYLTAVSLVPITSEDSLRDHAGLVATLHASAYLLMLATVHASSLCFMVLASKVVGYVSHQASSEGTSPPPSSTNKHATETQHQPAQPKRRRKSEDQGGGDEDDENGSGDDRSAGRGTKKRRKEDGTRPFACPFYKKDPYNHIECKKYTLVRVRDVKQHLHRRHSQPALYCPSCYQTFSSPPYRDDHIRSRSCRSRSPPTMDGLNGISPEAQRLLGHRVDRSLTPYDQWYCIWEILFPGEPRPRDPYLGTLFEENFDMMRNLWTQEGYDIVRELLQRRGEKGEGLISTEGLLQGEIIELFNEVQDRLEQKVQRGRPAQSSSLTAINSHYSLAADHLITKHFSMAPDVSASSSSSDDAELTLRHTSPPDTGLTQLVEVDEFRFLFDGPEQSNEDFSPPMADTELFSEFPTAIFGIPGAMTVVDPQFSWEQDFERWS